MCNWLRFETRGSGRFTFFYVLFYCHLLPFCVCIRNYGHDVLFVHQSDVLLDSCACFVGKCSEDTEEDFCVGVDVVFNLLKSPIVHHSEYCDRVGVGYWCSVDSFFGLCVVFTGPG